MPCRDGLNVSFYIANCLQYSKQRAACKSYFAATNGLEPERQKELIQPLFVSFFVRVGVRVRIFPPLNGDDQTLCRAATEARTGRAYLRIALRRVVVGRGARACRGQSVEFFPCQPSGGGFAAWHGRLRAGSLCEGQGEFPKAHPRRRSETG